MNKGVVAAHPRHQFGICAPTIRACQVPGPPRREVRNMEKLLLSPAEAVVHLSIGRSKIYELMRLGQLRSVKIGASRRIPQTVVSGRGLGRSLRPAHRPTRAGARAASCRRVRPRSPARAFPWVAPARET